MGSNHTLKRRCETGYTGTVCATCAKDYVFRREECLPCEGYVPGGVTSPTGEALTGALICMITAMIVLYFYFTLPALTKEEEDDLRVKLSALDIEAVFKTRRNLSMLTFGDLVYRDLTDGEIAHIFQVIDTDESGYISKTELLDYITDDGEIDIDTIQDKHDDLRDKQENSVESMETMGTALMKVKIMLSYMQCMTFLPVVFEMPFPRVLRSMLALLEISSLDIYVFFGELSCHMQTTFEQKFVFHMLLLPVLCACTGLVWKLVLLRKAYCNHCPARFTRESMRSRLNGFGSILSFGVYAGLSTKIFRLFKCRKIDQHFYLTADYSLMCYEGRWWNYGGVAIAGMLLYVVGIPIVQFIILWKNRAHLYEDTSLDEKAHRQVKKQYGSLYLHFKEDCYYYELVNMFRKLMMTGGLILLGGQSTVQGLLGILVCALWLLLVAIKFPYAVYWDNMLEIALSFGLMITLLSGLALELFRLKEFDGKEQIVFDVLLVLMLLFGLLAGCFALATTLPVCRPYVARLLFWNTKKTSRKFLNGWVKKNLVYAKWLSVAELKGMMRSTEGTLKKMAKEKVEHAHKKRRMSRKIYPSRKDTISIDIMLRTKRLVKRRTKMLKVRKALLPAARKRAKPSLKSYATVVRSHFASRRNQRKLHKEEVDRIHEDRNSKMIHLKKKQEEVLRTKEQKRQLLEKRIESRNRAKTNAKGHLTSATKGVPVAENTSAPKAVVIPREEEEGENSKSRAGNEKTSAVAAAEAAPVEVEIGDAPPPTSQTPLTAIIARQQVQEGVTNTMPDLTDKWEDTKKLMEQITMKPSMKEKLLRRPPFRYLHDILMGVNRETNFFTGLYKGDETNSELLQGKDAKINFLTKAIKHVNNFYETELKVDPLKIVAGKEAHLTNRFLQAVAHAALSRANSNQTCQKKPQKL